MQSYVICCLETYVEASLFSGIAHPVLNMSHFILSVALGLVTEETQYCVHGGLQQIKGSLANMSLGLTDFLLTDFFGPCQIFFAIMGCLAISLLIAACLTAGSLVDGPRSVIPFWATILLAIVQFGIHLAFTIIPVNDIPNNLNNIWVLSCIGMAIADFWIIFVALKAKQEISSNVGYKEIA